MILKILRKKDYLNYKALLESRLNNNKSQSKTNKTKKTTKVKKKVVK